jgi:ADP-heptose:LPS heptosyltransferase
LPSTSAKETAQEVLACCFRGERPPRELLDALRGHAPELFGIVAEGLADRFERRLCDAYAEIFAEVLSSALPELKAPELIARYQRVRQPRRFKGNPCRVFVLSRVTLGADVAITSVMLHAAKDRFPEAQIYFVGGPKSWELFEGDPRLSHLPVSYGRTGTLEERLDIWSGLRETLSGPDSIVIDPDSRLTQLGLLPVCPEAHYYFFEGRAYGGDSGDYLGTLASRWARETFEIKDAKPYIAVPPADHHDAIAISFGVGENPAKRVPDPFEEELLRHLLAGGHRILIDKGAGGEEAARVEAAIARCGPNGGRIETWQGAFARFAGRIAQSRLYIGYDSAGQHVAAACGVPSIAVFAGFPCERFLARWSPPSAAVIRVDRPDPAQVTAAIIPVLQKFLLP